MRCGALLRFTVGAGAVSQELTLSYSVDMVDITQKMEGWAEWATLTNAAHSTYLMGKEGNKQIHVARLPAQPVMTEKGPRWQVITNPC